MTPKPCPVGDLRTEIAKLIALAGLGTVNGEPRTAGVNWSPQEHASRILEIIPGRAEKQCFALADQILAINPHLETLRQIASGYDRGLSAGELARMAQVEVDRLTTSAPR